MYTYNLALDLGLVKMGPFMSIHILADKNGGEE